MVRHRFHPTGDLLKKHVIVLVCGFLLLGLNFTHAEANDLNDGIGLDDSTIAKYDSLDPDMNKRFIKMMVKAKENQNDSAKALVAGDAVQGGVIIKAGAQVNGDIIVVYEGKDNIVLSEKK